MRSICFEAIQYEVTLFLFLVIWPCSLMGTPQNSRLSPPPPLFLSCVKSRPPPADFGGRKTLLISTYIGTPVDLRVFLHLLEINLLIPTAEMAKFVNHDWVGLEVMKNYWMSTKFHMPICAKTYYRTLHYLLTYHHPPLP